MPLPDVAKVMLCSKSSEPRIRRRDLDCWHLCFCLTVGKDNFMYLQFREGQKTQAWGRILGEDITTAGASRTFVAKAQADHTMLCAMDQDRDDLIFMFDIRRPYDSFAQFTQFIMAERRLQRKVPARIHVDRNSVIVDPTSFLALMHSPIAVKEMQEPDAANIIRYPAYTSGQEFREICDCLLSTEQPVGPDLLITLEVEKRAWAEQVEGLSLFLQRRLKLSQPLGKILINGMTASASGQLPDSEAIRAIDETEAEICEGVKQRVGRPLDITSLFGMTFAEKYHAVSDVGFFLSPLGSGCLIPLIRRMPGVVYQNQKWIRWKPGIDYPRLFRIPESDITDRVDIRGIRKDGSMDQMTSYSIDPTIFAEHAIRTFLESTCAPRT